MPTFHVDEVTPVSISPPSQSTATKSSGEENWFAKNAPTSQSKTSTKSLDQDAGIVHKARAVAAKPLVDFTKLGVPRPQKHSLTGREKEKPLNTTQKVARGVIGGAESIATDLTSPEQIALLVGTWGLGSAENIGLRIANKLASAGFGVEQLKSAWDSIPKFRYEVKRGDIENASKTATEATVSAGLGASALLHGAKARTPEKAPEPKIAAPEAKKTARPPMAMSNAALTQLLKVEAQEGQIGSTRPEPTKPRDARIAQKKTATKPPPKVNADQKKLVLTQEPPKIGPLAATGEVKPVSVAEVKPETKTEATQEPAPPAFQNGFVAGKSGNAKVARGYKVPFKYAVVDADNLITSHDPQTLQENPAFDQSIQPRDRSRAGYEEQINTMVGSIDPEELGHNYKASDGAPIVGDDGMVESGNGRTIALKRIYSGHPEKASDYSSWLKENAGEFGLDAKQIDRIKNPVLVRLRSGLPEGVTRSDFAKHANEDSKATMGAVETAASDAKALTPEVMALFEPSETGEINTAGNREFASKFASSIVGPGQKNPFMLGDGSISAEGVRRIRNAIFAKAYGGSTALDKLAEDPSDNTKSITNGLVTAAPKFADMQSAIERGDLYDLNPAPAISRAVSRLTALRDSKTSIQDFLKQEDLYGKDPMEGNILDIFDRHKRSAARIADVFRTYADLVEAVGSPKQSGLFAQEPPTAIEVLKEADKIVTEEQEARERAKEEKSDSTSLFNSASTGNGEAK